MSKFLRRGVRQIGLDAEDNLNFGGEGDGDYFRFEEGNGIVLGSASRATLP